jgi:hypothetical protein
VPEFAFGCNEFPLAAWSHGKAKHTFPVAALGRLVNRVFVGGEIDAGLFIVMEKKLAGKQNTVRRRLGNVFS